ncbi:MAG: WbqC family protein [Actinobacteria bacterium]|nr:WbqC family protein [Actinomycetota bacterium]
MIVTVHQPEHLPWLGFFNKVDRADVLVLFDVVQYRKNYFQNRNRIWGRPEPQWLTVPVLTKGHTERTIAQMEINNATAWRPKHWKTLTQTYGRHPFFDEHHPFLERVYEKEWALLAELNEHLIRHLLDVLDIRTEVVRASDLQVSGGGTDLLLSICSSLGAGAYLAGQLADEYLDEEPFAGAGIEVLHHDFEHPSYPQHGADRFSSHLSVVDLLFNCGPGSLEVIRSGTRSLTSDR